jgi:hypothetical protein
MSDRSGTYAIANLYDKGLSWGEAACSELTSLKSIAVPIGDPLARVVVFDPDLNADGKIDEADFVILMSHWEETGPGIEGDINQDGIVNITDW